MSETMNPATFSLDDWTLDAALPEESADVYKRADVVGELSRLKRQIALQKEASGVEKTAEGDTTLQSLEAEYDTLVETFASSQLTVYVRAITSDELNDLREEHDKETKTWDPIRRNKEFGFKLLAQAIISVKPFEGERTDVRWDLHQVKRLEQAIGPAQIQAILEARQIAQNQLPSVDADFLHSASGSETGAD